MPLPQRTYSTLKSLKITNVARQFGVLPSTVQRWLNDNDGPQLLTLAVENLHRQRRPVSETTLVFNYPKLGVPLHIVVKNPRLARHALRTVIINERQMTQNDADMFFEIVRSKLRPWTDNTFHDPHTNATLRKSSFDRLAAKGWVTYAPRLRRVILTRTGRTKLEAWNAPHNA